jgi:endonuclease/exonuclease/phosphatase family metal-dependent hydrolase
VGIAYRHLAVLVAVNSTSWTAFIDQTLSPGHLRGRCSVVAGGREGTVQMDVTVGTFNLNNLFTRWNFQADITPGTQLTQVTEFTSGDNVRFRSFKGNVVHGKDAVGTAQISARVLSMNVDVLAVQEVENIEALQTFNTEQLGGSYPYVVLIEGNDPRLIDVGVMSKLPIGRIVSHQTEPDPARATERVFGRDLLQVDVLSLDRTRRLFTLFNTHLKSNYVDWRERDPIAAAVAANKRRERQAAATAGIIQRELRPNSRYVVVGDMNDDPDSEFMAPLTAGTLNLVDALTNVVETRPAKPESTGPQPGPRWTSRHKQSATPAVHRLFDQIWVSPPLGPKVTNATIDRRTRHSGDGSDHDPAWITLDKL